MALPIPTAGISVVFGVPLILISTQLLLGRRCAWLPARLTRRSVTRTDLTAFVERWPIIKLLGDECGRADGARRRFTLT
jgi:hypothetical protein